MQIGLALAAVLAIQDVAIIDVIEGKTLPRRTVVVKEGRISAITTGKPPQGAQVVNGSGKFLIPGLWDMHIHLRGGAESMRANDAMLNLYLAHGVTGVREMGGDLTDTVFQWRDAIDDGKKLGPKIFTSGPKLDGAKPAWPGSLPVTSPEQAAAAVAQLAAKNADLVKLYFDTLDEATLKAITAAAHKQKLKVAGHLPRNLTVRDSIEAGIDEVQHAYYYLLAGASVAEGSVSREFGQRAASGNPMTTEEWARRLLDDYSQAQAQAMVAMLAKNEVYVTPTLDAGNISIGVGTQPYGRDLRARFIPKGIYESWDPNKGRRRPPSDSFRKIRGEMNQRAVGLIRLLRDGGVALLAGSDSGHSNNNIYPGWSLHEEMSLLRDAGLSNAEALRTATINAAEFFKATKRHGSIDKGKAADLVLLDADPLVDIRNTQRISGVVRAGRWLDRQSLDQLMIGAGRN